MRGEHRLSMLQAFAREGSSPHARGALAEAKVGMADKGIIPACAGSTQG